MSRSHFARRIARTATARHPRTTSLVSRAVLFVTVVAVLGVVTAVDSASAVVADHLVVSATSSRNTSNVKSATASCPPGLRAIGAGVSVESPGNHIILEGLRPTATGVTATGHANSGTNTWAVTAQAICAEPPAGLEIVSVTSPSNANRPKTATAACPGAKRVIGAGAEILGGNGKVVIDGMRPFGTEVDASGDVIGTYDEPWSVRSYAICADPLAGQQIVTRLSDIGSLHTQLTATLCPTGTRLLGTGFDVVGGSGEVGVVQLAPSSMVRISAVAAEHSDYPISWQVNSIGICGGLNLEVVASSSPSNAASPKSRNVNCPGSKRVVGTGFRVTGNAPGNVVVDRMMPSTPTRVSVRGIEDENGTLGTWSVSARAVCANPLPGRQIVTATSETDSGNPKFVTATCPFGKQVIGTGAAISGGAGEVSLDDVVPSRTEVTASAREDDTGTTRDWSVTAFAVCANPLADRQVVTARTVTNSFVAKSATAICPSDTRLTGTGFRIDGALGEVRVENVQPGSNVSPTNVSVQANEDDDGTTRNWALTAYAICATP